VDVEFVDLDTARPSLKASKMHSILVVELPIIFVDRKVGESKMSNDIVRDPMTNVWNLRFGKARGATICSRSTSGMTSTQPPSLC
jgi:hypothetical protein